MLKASFYRGSGAEVNLMHGAICPRKVLEEKDEFGVICIVSSFQFRSIMRKKQVLLKFCAQYLSPQFPNWNTENEMSTDFVVVVCVIVGRQLFTGKNINRLFTFRPKMNYTIHIHWIVGGIIQIIQTHWNTFLPYLDISLTSDLNDPDNDLSA